MYKFMKKILWSDDHPIEKIRKVREMNISGNTTDAFVINKILNKKIGERTKVKALQSIVKGNAIGVGVLAEIWGYYM